MSKARSGGGLRAVVGVDDDTFCISKKFLLLDLSRGKLQKQ